MANASAETPGSLFCFGRLPSVSRKARFFLWEEVLRRVLYVGAVPSAATFRGKAFGVGAHRLLFDHS